MEPLRTICLVFLCLSASACLAQDERAEGREPTETKKAKRTEPYRLPFMLDAAATLRTDGDSVGWYGADVQFRVGIEKLFGDLLNFSPSIYEDHQLSFDTGWERGFGVSPNPQRFWLTAGYSFAGDIYGTRAKDRDWQGSLSRRGEFPLTRSVLIAAGTGFSLGYHYGEGTQVANDADALDHRSAVRAQTWGFLGLALFEFRVDAALNVNLDPGVFLEPEFGVGVRIGRPISPVFLYAGWSWLPFEQGGGHFLTLKLGVVL
ncbi:MAG: hypothetical protein KDB32_09370 [Planctomycetes bacterium]|nr:hypothetical protein [Planctomycetota bacterium]MCA8947533.1 hypothetical protein [Planctomycetota bacterium]